MSAIPSLGGPGTETARIERTTLAVGKALQETRKEAQAMVRLIEASTGSSKGQVVDYRA